MFVSYNNPLTHFKRGEMNDRLLPDAF